MEHMEHMEHPMRHSYPVVGKGTEGLISRNILLSLTLFDS